jgi:hypothetical protein
VGPEHSEPYWQVYYWDNMTLSGNPIVHTVHTSIDHDWGTGSPYYLIPVDGFSARWTRIIDMAAGTYQFGVTADDGIRVWVDDDLIIDGWKDQPPTTYTARKYLGAGHHQVRVEYYENQGIAVARLVWAPVDPAITGWRAEYFGNRSLSGSPLLVRGEERIDYYWGNDAPAPGMPADGFSARWSRTLHLNAGSYRFTATTDDGVRLWVAGHLLIDNWNDQPFRSAWGTIYVSGDVPVTMEYYENLGLAGARLTWERVDDDQAPPGNEVIVDDTSPGFVQGGASSGWHSAAEGYGGHLTWTRNNDWVRSNYNWGRWYPDLAAGRYEVLVHIPERYTSTARARYWISHRGGYTLRTVDQSATGGRWVSLGTYWFRGTRDDYVSLADITYEPYLTRLVAWDAVKWVPR